MHISSSNDRKRKCEINLYCVRQEQVAPRGWRRKAYTMEGDSFQVATLFDCKRKLPTAPVQKCPRRIHKCPDKVTHSSVSSESPSNSPAGRAVNRLSERNLRVEDGQIERQRQVGRMFETKRPCCGSPRCDFVPCGFQVPGYNRH